MKFTIPAIAGAAALLALAACAAATGEQTSDPIASAPAATGEPLYVRQVMQQRINPAMLAVWDVGNNAMNEEGGIDPALMDAAKWSSLHDAATRLAAAAKDMAAAQVIRAAHPSNTGVAEGEVSMAKVQQLIDSDPAGFRRLAADQAAHAGLLATAAAGGDAATAGPLVAEMDGVCESCHARYWYAE
jgi:cytochrome c556